MLARLQERDRAVDAAAHRDRDSPWIGSGTHRRPERVRERVDRQRLAADRSRLEQRQAAQVLGDAGRICVDDPVAVDAQAHEREVVAARGIPISSTMRPGYSRKA